MDLSTMRDQVREIVGETTAADFWSDAALNKWLNEAQRRFAQSEKWPWLLTEGSGTLVAGDPDVELTEGVSVYRHMNILLTRSGVTRPWLPERVLPSEGFLLRQRYYTSTVEPRWFYVTSVADADADGQFITVIKFIPEPTVECELEYQYYRMPVDLSGASDVPDFPVETHMALVHYAAARAWEKELDGRTKADEQDALYNYVVDQARSEYLNATQDAPLVAGSQPPQFGQFVDSDAYTRQRIADTLGP